MIKEIVKNDFFLSQKSKEACKCDKEVIVDLLDTLEFHKEHCVGMAANMIGSLKRIIVVNNEGKYLVMVNPIVLKTSGRMYTCNESCLSHEGEKSVKRVDKIKVSYLDENFKKRIDTFSDFTAQIIQHEMDHLEGVLI